MEFDNFVFPAPRPSYSYAQYKNQFFFVPKCKIVNGFTNFSFLDPATNGISHIPCIYIPYSNGSSKILLYFHGNAEDLGKVCPLMSVISCELKVHIVAIEYSGYGIYPGTANANRITEDALNVYDYLTEVLGWRQSNIIVFGRSIGSGFATYLAAKRSPGMLILISAFTSLKAVVSNFAWVLTFLVADRLKNIELIPFVKCPKIFIHGKDDTLVNSENSEVLFAEAKEPKQLFIFKGMDHNKFDLSENLLSPIFEFWTTLKFNTTAEVNHVFPLVKTNELPQEFTIGNYTECSCGL